MRSDPVVMRVPVEAEAVTARLYEAATSSLDSTLILAHGAGAGQQTPFLTGFAHGLAALGLDVVTFNFLYTEKTRRIPDPRPRLEGCYRAVIEYVRAHVGGVRKHLFVGGKSMGGRISTQVAAADPALPIAGLVLLGYPLHPPGRPDNRRDAHFPDIVRPMLFVQGERDTFGTPLELESAIRLLPAPATLHVVDGGDHSFKVRRASADGQQATYEELQRIVAAWVHGVIATGSSDTALPPR